MTTTQFRIGEVVFFRKPGSKRLTEMHVMKVYEEARCLRLRPAVFGNEEWIVRQNEVQTVGETNEAKF